MPKRRKLVNSDYDDRDHVFAARGRLMGAIMEACDPNFDDDSSNDEHSSKNRITSYSTSVRRDLNSDLMDEKKSTKKGGLSPNKNNSYVMKLFDRSVDLAQFDEDTPLYPICRAWMANQPRTYGRSKSVEPDVVQEKFNGLPPPEGPQLQKVPPLLPEQCQFLKEEINFDYNVHSPPSIDHLMDLHKMRWGAVRRKWLQQSALYESRYAKTQAVLKEMDNCN